MISEDFLSKKEKERYSRQILYFGGKKQNTLKNSHIIVIGAGGIGCPVLQYLASSGVGTITLFEDDFVELSNLSRQILFSENDIGQPKGKVAIDKISLLNPHITIRWIPHKFNINEHEAIFQSADLIIEGSDSISNKFMVNDATLHYNKVSLIGALGVQQGHIVPIHRAGVCYRCLFEKPPTHEDEIPTCGSTNGIISPLAGVIGSMMAYLAIAFLTNDSFDSKFFILEGVNWRTLQLKKRLECHLHL